MVATCEGNVQQAPAPRAPHCICFRCAVSPTPSTCERLCGVQHTSGISLSGSKFARGGAGSCERTCRAEQREAASPYGLTLARFKSIVCSVLMLCWQ